MDRPPLPPHERSWRHPSELGPTAADVDDGGPSRGGMLLGGASVLLVAVGVLAIAAFPTPRGGDQGASATTIASIVDPPRITPRLTIAMAESVGEPATAPVALAPPKRIPNAVSSAAAPGPRDPAADSLPDPADVVIVLTSEMTYQLPWAALPWLEVGDGAIVLDHHGALIGHIEDRVLIAADPDLADD